MPDNRPERATTREITEADRHEICAFLARGFHYPVSFYEELFDKLARRDAPEGYPRFGYAIRAGGRIVGSIFLIFTRMRENGADFIRCHVTSWCVEQEYRAVAALFFARGLRFPNVDYINVSAGAWTRPIIESQGFRRYSNGQFYVKTPLAALRREAGRVLKTADASRAASIDPVERKLLDEHEGFGCVSLWVQTSDAMFPFVFHRRLYRNLIPGAQLVYSRDIDSFAQFAGPLARALLRRGALVMSVDANAAIVGLPGRYIPGKDQRFCKGRQPRQGDLAYTQLAMCRFVRGDHGG
ncbi:MAG: hypothetical protein KGM42_01360 [Hyphomicrobiales bacterium]|nr:hypothetical protein [Hyphomicrobiales bacterium]